MQSPSLMHAAAEEIFASLLLWHSALLQLAFSQLAFWLAVWLLLPQIGQPGAGVVLTGADARAVFCDVGPAWHVRLAAAQSALADVSFYCLLS